MWHRDRLIDDDLIAARRHWVIHMDDCKVELRCTFFMSRRGRDSMVIEFTTIYAISAYHSYSCEFEICSWRGVFDRS